MKSAHAILLLATVLLCLNISCKSSSSQINERIPTNAVRASFEELHQWSTGLHFRTESDSLVRIHLPEYSRCDYDLSFLLASWLKQQDCYVFPDGNKMDWGIFINSTFIRSGDLLDQVDASFEDIYGMGYLINSDFHHPLSVYASPEESSLIRSVALTDSSIQGKVEVDHYFLLHLAVVERVEDWYQVEINSITGELAWVKESEYFTYYPWPDYIAECFSVQWPEEPLVHSNSFETAETFDLPNANDYIRIFTIQEDWIQIAKHDFNPDTDDFTNAGWIRWRNGLRILVRLAWLC